MILKCSKTKGGPNTNLEDMNRTSALMYYVHKLHYSNFLNKKITHKNGRKVEDKYVRMSPRTRQISNLWMPYLLGACMVQLTIIMMAKHSVLNYGQKIRKKLNWISFLCFIFFFEHVNNTPCQ